MEVGASIYEWKAREKRGIVLHMLTLQEFQYMETCHPAVADLEI